LRLLLIGSALTAALLVLPGESQAQDDVSSVFSRLLNNPNDAALNARYAALVEARGDMRKALGAYERALAVDPGNRDLLRAYKRVKRRLLPAVTSVTVEKGISYDSNPRQLPNTRRREGDVTFDVSAYLFDERTLRRHRWRTEAYARGQIQGDETDLNAGEVAAWTGPVFDLNPKTRLHFAPGAAVAWLDGRRLYNDGSLRVTLERVRRGTTQSVSALLTYRDAGDSFNGSDGFIAQLSGRFKFNSKLVKGDTIYVLPRVRYSGPTGSGPGRVFSRPLFPGDFVETGSRFAYFRPIRGGKVFIGAGFATYFRHYDQTVAFGTAEREDVQVEPTAHVIFPNVGGRKFDFRIDYRYEENFSNDNTEDFSNHVVGGRVVKRF